MAIPRGGQRGDEQVAVENEVASARPATEPAEAPRVEPAPAKSMLRAASPAPAKRQAKRAADELKVERTGGAPSPRLVAREAAGPAAEADFAPSPGGEQARAESVEASCRRQIEALERRKRDAQAAAIEPEEELAIGKCYQALGNLAGARKWLRRAARHPETRARAEEALHQLAPQ